MIIPGPNQSVEATATRRRLRPCHQDIERRMGYGRTVTVAAPHLSRSAHSPVA
jgi:hypothetical protein